MEKTMNAQLAVCANELDRPARSKKLTIDRFSSTDGFATLVCHGRLTVETCSLFKSAVKSLSPHFLYVMADLGDVDFVDASGLGGVLAAYVSARSAGCELKLINVHPRVKDLLNMARLASVLEDRVWEPGSPPLCRY
jgi:anti-anti-sigma factor